MTVVYRLVRPPASSADRKRAEWVAELMPGAEPTARLIGISPEAIIAQAALETGWGRSAIGKNIFGIKAHGGWTGKVQEVRTWEDTNGPAPGGEVYITDRFRDYDSFAESFADHFRFLQENSRYRANGVFDRKGDEAYFAALQRAGYATDPAYAAKLTSILGLVRSYTAGMERVEVGELPSGYAPTPSGNIVRENIGDSKIVKDADAVSTVTKAATAGAAVIAPASMFAGMDWRVVAVIGGVAVVGLLAFTVYKVIDMKRARLEMHRQGIA